MEKISTMNLDIQLRKFTLSDLDRISEIERSSFTDDAYSKTRFESLYRKHPDDFIVAELEGKIVGYIIAYDSGGFGDFDSVAVDPKYRGFGIGCLLVNYMLDRFKQKGLKRASLEVRTTNKTAISFYQKLGFKITKTITGFYRGSGNAYRMERAI
jgi:ribosomal-protein-alanine N-acetyltransferase